MTKKSVCILFPLMAVIGTISKYFIINYAVDSKNGFFMSEMRPFGIAVTVFVFAIALFLFFVGMATEREKFNFDEPNIFSAVLLSVYGFALIFDVLTSSADNYLMGIYFNLIRIFGILTAVVFIFYGASLFIGFSIKKWFFLIPSVFYIVKLVGVFTTYSQKATITEHVFELSVNAALLVFMLLFSEGVAGIKKENKREWLFPVGITASFIILVSTVSDLVMIITGMSDRLHGTPDFYASTLIMGIFAFAFSVSETKEIEDEE